MEVIYEDNHIIAVNKAVSEISQGDRTGDVSLDMLIRDFIKKKYNKQGNVFLGVIHRIDRPVSGVVLYAKTGKALSRLNEMLKERQIEKVYYAVVKEKPPEESGTLVNFLTRNTKQNKSYAHDKEVKDSKKSILHYKIAAKSDNYYLLEIILETGRHHQIRSQLAHIGCPIKGDLKYGAPRSNKNGGIHLHSYKTSFVHPVTKEPVTIMAPFPEDNLWQAFAKDIATLTSTSAR